MKTVYVLLFILISFVGFAAGNEGLILSEKSNPEVSDVYPNPFTNKLSINFTNPESGIVVVKMYDVIGNEVYNNTFEADQDLKELTLFLDEKKVFQNGVYILKIEYNGQTFVNRLFKK